MRPLPSASQKRKFCFYGVNITTIRDREKITTRLLVGNLVVVLNGIGSCYFSNSMI